MDVKRLLGYELRLKPGQREAIDHLFNGRDVLGVLPTVYGKSLIYQMFTLAKTKATKKAMSVLIICPLESIANDQIHEACSLGFSAGLLREANKDGSGNYPQLLFSSAEEIEECKARGI